MRGWMRGEPSHFPTMAEAFEFTLIKACDSTQDGFSVAAEDCSTGAWMNPSPDEYYRYSPGMEERSCDGRLFFSREGSVSHAEWMHYVELERRKKAVNLYEVSNIKSDHFSVPVEHCVKDKWFQVGNSFFKYATGRERLERDGEYVFTTRNLISEEDWSQEIEKEMRVTENRRVAMRRRSAVTGKGVDCLVSVEPDQIIAPRDELCVMKEAAACKIPYQRYLILQELEPLRVDAALERLKLKIRSLHPTKEYYKPGLMDMLSCLYHYCRIMSFEGAMHKREKWSPAAFEKKLPKVGEYDLIKYAYPILLTEARQYVNCFVQTAIGYLTREKYVLHPQGDNVWACDDPDLFYVTLRTSQGQPVHRKAEYMYFATDTIGGVTARRLYVTSEGLYQLAIGHRISELFKYTLSINSREITDEDVFIREFLSLGAGELSQYLMGVMPVPKTVKWDYTKHENAARMLVDALPPCFFNLLKKGTHLPLVHVIHMTRRLVGPFASQVFKEPRIQAVIDAWPASKKEERLDKIDAELGREIYVNREKYADPYHCKSTRKIDSAACPFLCNTRECLSSVACVNTVEITQADIDGVDPNPESVVLTVLRLMETASGK